MGRSITSQISGIGVEDKDSAARYGSHSSPGEPSTPPSSGLIFSSPCCVGEAHGVLQTGHLTDPQSRLKHEPAEKTLGRLCVAGPQEQVSGMPALFLPRATGTFLCAAVPEGLQYVGLLYPLALCG